MSNVRHNIWEVFVGLGVILPSGRISPEELVGKLCKPFLIDQIVFVKGRKSSYFLRSAKNLYYPGLPKQLASVSNCNKREHFKAA